MAQSVLVDPINTFHSTYKTDNEPIRLSYHGNVHYNSVVDPRKATIGVGLGLPGLQPGVCVASWLLCDIVQESGSTLLRNIANMLDKMLCRIL